MGNFNDIPPKAKKIVGYWLLGCAGAVFGTVMVGGITRLETVFIMDEHIC
jgi:hypothetical protein